MPIPTVMRKYGKNIFFIVLANIVRYLMEWQLDQFIAPKIFWPWYKIPIIGDFIWMSNQNFYILCFIGIEIAWWTVHAAFWFWD